MTPKDPKSEASVIVGLVRIDPTKRALLKRSGIRNKSKKKVYTKVHKIKRRRKSWFTSVTFQYNRNGENKTQPISFKMRQQPVLRCTGGRIRVTVKLDKIGVTYSYFLGDEEGKAKARATAIAQYIKAHRKDNKAEVKEEIKLEKTAPTEITFSDDPESFDGPKSFTSKTEENVQHFKNLGKLLTKVTPTSDHEKTADRLIKHMNERQEQWKQVLHKNIANNKDAIAKHIRDLDKAFDELNSVPHTPDDAPPALKSALKKVRGTRAKTFLQTSNNLSNLVMPSIEAEKLANSPPKEARAVSSKVNLLGPAILRELHKNRGRNTPAPVQLPEIPKEENKATPAPVELPKPSPAPIHLHKSSPAPVELPEVSPQGLPIPTPVAPEEQTQEAPRPAHKYKRYETAPERLARMRSGQAPREEAPLRRQSQEETPAERLNRIKRGEKQEKDTGSKFRKRAEETASERLSRMKGGTAKKLMKAFRRTGQPPAKRLERLRNYVTKHAEREQYLSELKKGHDEIAAILAKPTKTADDRKRIKELRTEMKTFKSKAKEVAKNLKLHKKEGRKKYVDPKKKKKKKKPISSARDHQNETMFELLERLVLGLVTDIRPHDVAIHDLLSEKGARAATAIQLGRTLRDILEGEE